MTLFPATDMPTVVPELFAEDTIDAGDPGTQAREGG